MVFQSASKYLHISGHKQLTLEEQIPQPKRNGDPWFKAIYGICNKKVEACSKCL